MRYKIHQRVELLSVNTDEQTFGIVNGYGFITHESGTVYPVVMVKLDNGFYDEKKVHWTSTVVVHENSLAAVAIN